MKSLKHYFLLLMVLPFALSAQNTSLNNQDWPIKLSILDESISYPTLKLFQWSYNPAFTIGTEYLWKEKEKSSWYFGTDLGFYHHEDWKSAVFVLGSLGYRRHFGRLNLVLSLGTGYAHTFTTKPVYRNENGEWQRVSEKGNPALMLQVKSELSYALKDKSLSPELFISFAMAADVPFSIFSGLHQLTGIGFKFYPNF